MIALEHGAEEDTYSMEASKNVMTDNHMESKEAY